MTERILRWTGILVAVLAWVDPQITVAGRVRPRVGVVTSGGGTAASAASRDVVRRLAKEFEIVASLDPTAKALVVVGDRYPDEPIGPGRNVSTVSVEPSTAAVFVKRVAAPAVVPPATTVRLGIDVAASHTRGRNSELSVRSGGAEVAHRSHVWTSDAEVWHADVDVVPVGDAPFVFDISVDGNNHAFVAVDGAPRLRVLVVESRPSWATAFVRRALEEDPRFDVSGVAAASPQAAVRSGASPAVPDDLRTFDAILVGGLERLVPANAAAFERFVRDRGGALLLVPDAAIPSGLSQRLLPGIAFHETLLERTARLEVAGAAPLEASELLETTELPIPGTVIARATASGRPVIWSVPFGDGQIVVSGALDAWRRRGSDAAAFDRFWRSLVAGAALSARPAVDVALYPDRALPGERVRVVARVRRLEREQLGDRLSIGARVGAAPIRLWPDAPAGVFSGSFIVDARANATNQRVTAALADGSAGSARLSIQRQADPHVSVPLSWLSSTRGGVDVTPSAVEPLIDHLRRTVVSEVAREPRHPMRSGWWFVPFAACLSAEWWLRRRRGAR